MKHHLFVILDNALRGAWYSHSKFPLSEGLSASARLKPSRQPAQKAFF